MPTQPDIEQVRAWIGVPSQVVDDAQLQGVLDAELAAQAQVCNVDTWADQLTQAIYRRCGREVAAMALPLGVVAPDSEYGGGQLPRYDAEIERLERPFRKVVMG